MVPSESQIQSKTLYKPLELEGGRWSVYYLLASSKTSGSSLASFSLATSAIGPKITTGLRNPATQEQINHG